MAVDIFWWILIVSAVAYSAVMIVITIGWYRIRQFDSPVNAPLPEVSIVVAVRNEEKNIRNLLANLYKLDYPAELLEIIIVDDHSEDQTRRIIGAFRKEKGIKNLILGKPEKGGKKAAIAHGIYLAAGDLIVTTDGDCLAEPEWLMQLVSFYQHKQPELILGPVVYHNEKGLLQKFFSIDFMSLVASGAGSAGAGKPLMGNGANLLFRRNLIKEIQENLTGDAYASGDDVFLIQKILEDKGSEAIKFLKNQQAIIYTSPPASLAGFLKQRIRWASKAKGYRSHWAVMVSLAVLFFNFMLTMTFMGGFFKSWFFVFYVLFVLLKYLIDLPLINEFANFVNKQKLKPYLPLFEFLYPFYIVIVSFVSLFFKYEWKGRSGLR